MDVPIVAGASNHNNTPCHSNQSFADQMPAKCWILSTASLLNIVDFLVTSSLTHTLPPKQDVTSWPPGGRSTPLLCDILVLHYIWWIYWSSNSANPYISLPLLPLNSLTINILPFPPDHITLSVITPSGDHTRRVRRFKVYTVSNRKSHLVSKRTRPIGARFGRPSTPVTATVIDLCHLPS